MVFLWASVFAVGVVWLPSGSYDGDALGCFVFFGWPESHFPSLAAFFADGVGVVGVVEHVAGVVVVSPIYSHGSFGLLGLKVWLLAAEVVVNTTQGSLKSRD